MQTKNKYIYFISPLIVLAVMLAVWIIRGIYPFGDMSFAGVDSYGQYIPFFARYIDKIKSGESFFYLWEASLGSDFWSINAYYTNSPLNLLFVLMGKDNLILCYGILRIAKLMVCAFTMSYYLLHKKGIRCADGTVIALSLMYALNNYMLGYSWSINWFDSIMVLPLVILGMEYILDGKSPAMYILALFYAVFCNYYIGVIICLFVFLYFFTYGFGSPVGRRFYVKDIFLKGMRMAGCSIVAILMSMVILVPVYFELQETYSRQGTVENLTTFWDVIRHFMVNDSICQMSYESGNYNLFVCTLMLPVLICSLKDRKKWYLTAIYVISFLSTKLDYVWHGFHSQNGVPGRYTFTFVFFAIVLINDFIGRKKSHTEIICYFLISGVLYVLCDIFSDDAGLGSTVIPFVLLVICLICFLADAAGMLTCILLCEVIIHSAFMMVKYLDNYTYTDTSYDTDVLSEAYDEINETDENKFYRTELTNYHDAIYNETIKDGFKGISGFNSAMYDSTYRFFNKLGFKTYVNHVFYTGQTPFTDSILNVRYNIEREGDYNLSSFERCSETENTTIYQNRYPLSIAFAVNENIKDISYLAAWDKNSLEYQSLIAGAMTGTAEELYSLCLSTNDITGDGNVYTVSFDIEGDGDYCIYQDTISDETIVKNNGTTIADMDYTSKVCYLKDLKQGDKISVQYVYDDDSSADRPGNGSRTYLYRVNDATDIYEELSQNLMTVTYASDNEIEGIINVPDGKTVYTSIPYSKGWKLYIDGKKAEYYEVLETFIGFDTENGEHTIRLVYVPYGFYAGLALSISGFAAFVIILAAGRLSGFLSHPIYFLKSKNTATKKQP